MTDLRGIPHIPGVLSAAELTLSAQHLGALQRVSGMIPWFPGGHCDPWNHVESAMALDIAGMYDEAHLAYRWLADIQRPDGSWHNYYLVDDDGDRTVSEAKLDTNVCAYVATGVLHHILNAPSITLADHAIAEFWPMVRKALDWVLGQRRADGLVLWAVEPDEQPWDYALLTGTSSIQHSLRCGAELAAMVGEDRIEWRDAANVMRRAVADRPSAFEPKERWAMDWYYPVLTGALDPHNGKNRLAAGWPVFIMEGLGARCVSDEPWVTASETAEASIAHAAVGDLDAAASLLAWTRSHRRDDGSYWTGIVHPDKIVFPDAEHTSYTAAAVILAADAITGTTPGSRLFTADGLGVLGH
jgi:hypothetical protein